MKNALFLAILFLGAGICSTQAQRSRNYTIAFYNSENLFDTKDDPAIDDSEFLPESKNQWTEDRYKKKLQNMAKVIDSLGGGPSVLGLSEVENRQVLEDLVNTDKLSKSKYGIVHENSPDGRGIDVALLYRKADFSPEFHKMLRIYKEDDPSFITRDIMLVKGRLHKQPVYFLVNHWPSRRGGEKESMGKRNAAAKVARAAVDSILRSNPEANIILMGDFNDEPTDSSVQYTLGASLKSDDKNAMLYNTMSPLKAAGDGTHYYKNEKNMLDQLIVSRNLLAPQSKLRLSGNSSFIYRPVWMQDQNPKYLGSPYRTYAGGKYIGGYSDHFPVYCIVEIQ